MDTAGAYGDGVEGVTAISQAVCPWAQGTAQGAGAGHASREPGPWRPLRRPHSPINSNTRYMSLSFSARITSRSLTMFGWSPNSWGES